MEKQNAKALYEGSFLTTKWLTLILLVLLKPLGSWWASLQRHFFQIVWQSKQVNVWRDRCKELKIGHVLYTSEHVYKSGGKQKKPNIGPLYGAAGKMNLKVIWHHLCEYLWEAAPQKFSHMIYVMVKATTVFFTVYAARSVTKVVPLSKWTSTVIYELLICQEMLPNIFHFLIYGLLHELWSAP